ncbi:hypothetical protein CRG98_019229 [Punica granatum]|uniref:Uncharacterized protein n=1 Tax=Punica granatum TaxID=22663 RepID=A0A2I0JWY2_PUNGR|nr:hypothetical protein CRG98_019229 [Punica granatum]
MRRPWTLESQKGSRPPLGGSAERPHGSLESMSISSLRIRAISGYACMAIRRMDITKEMKCVTMHGLHGKFGSKEKLRVGDPGGGRPRQLGKNGVGTLAPAKARCGVGLVGLLRSRSRCPWADSNVPSPGRIGNSEKKLGMNPNDQSGRVVAGKPGGFLTVLALARAGRDGGSGLEFERILERDWLEREWE